MLYDLCILRFSGPHLALFEKRLKQLNMKWEMLGDKQAFLRAVIALEIGTHMMSLDLRISFDDALDLLYDKQVVRYLWTIGFLRARSVEIY